MGAASGEPGKAGICKYCSLSLKNIKKNLVFERKVSYAGRSLIIIIPEDMAKHMSIEKGTIVRLIPVDKKEFLVELC
ncbi:hypothetical protein DRN67_01640 [Candidatus Micrarchaeota archaeon]|nr:MAG: hypothetical protein DRN67_01640 [Candidatus Micrarchaeota archaeon]